MLIRFDATKGCKTTPKKYILILVYSESDSYLDFKLKITDRFNQFLFGKLNLSSQPNWLNQRNMPNEGDLRNVCIDDVLIFCVEYSIDKNAKLLHEIVAEL